jgi:hypothetical protein
MDEDDEIERLDADPDRIRLEALVCALVARKRAAREGSAEHAFVVRQLQGIAQHREFGADFISYYDPDCDYGIY